MLHRFREGSAATLTQKKETQDTERVDKLKRLGLFKEEKGWNLLSRDVALP